MSTRAKRIVALVPTMIVLMLLSGCQNYEKAYRSLSVEHKNTVGLLEGCNNDKQNLSQHLTASQQQIADLQDQISRQNQTPAKATGFGDEYDVSFNAAEGTITVTLPNTVLFASGSADLLNTSQATLNKILDVIKQRYSGKQIDVIGHTDTDPIVKSKWKDNWELSAQRSLAVTRYMESKGIQANRLRAVGAGQARPIASNANAAGKAKNRRVEIVVRMR